MQGNVYIETSILGYLTAKSIGNLILATIKITQDWWNIHCGSFVPYAAEIVEDEAARGNTVIAVVVASPELAVI